MIRIRRALEVFQMAADASGIRAGQVVVVVDVALGARDGCVGAGQWEAGGRVIEIRVRPRNRVMALLAGLREAGTDVIRIRRSLEILQVTVDAGRIRAAEVVVIVDVTLRALHRGMCARQRETSGRVIKSCVCPRDIVVALLTSLRETRGHVVRVRRTLEVFQVATDARGIRGG